MAGKYPIKCDQGSTLIRRFALDTLRARIVAVTNVDNPVVSTDVPHGLSPGDVVVLKKLGGATGLNNTPWFPVWTVTTVPSPTRFSVTTSAPGTWTEGGTVSVPRDLTGSNARMQVRTDHAAPDTLLSLASPDDIAIAAPAGSTVVNEVTLTIDAATTAALTPGSYRYDLELVNPAGEVTRLLEGPFSVRPEVTRV